MCTCNFSMFYGSPFFVVGVSDYDDNWATS